VVVVALLLVVVVVAIFDCAELALATGSMSLPSECAELTDTVGSNLDFGIDPDCGREGGLGWKSGLQCEMRNEKEVK
jgi:hypothetical protein